MAHSSIEMSTLEIADVQRLLHSSTQGLSTEEAKRRLEKFGKNVLPASKRKSLIKIFIEQFNSALIYVLLGAALFACIIGEFVDSIFILAVLIINATIGSFHSYQAEKTFVALKNILRTTAMILRDQKSLTIDASEIVVGDVVLVESGSIVPSDIRLLSSQNLLVNESLLTGESAAIEKRRDTNPNVLTANQSRENILFAGTTVVRGRGKGMVFTTGADTTYGAIARAALDIKPGKPPIVLRVEKFSKLLTAIIASISVILIIYGTVSAKHSTREMIYFSIALAVSAIPEGLPIAMSLAFAIAARRMSRRGVIVKSLPSVEALGSCNVIATDKTGTLTCNEQTVERVILPNNRKFSVQGSGYHPEGMVLEGHSLIDPIHSPLSRIARASVLCNEGYLGKRDDDWVWSGDPTDIALLVFGAKAGWSQPSAENLYEKEFEIPFESDRQYSAAQYLTPEGKLILAKGSPETIITMCSDRLPKDQLKTISSKLAAEGYRTVALAEKVLIDSDPITQLEQNLVELNYLGVLGMKDPLREGVKASVEICQNAGIRVLMITGDHPETAKAIGKELGLIKDSIGLVTGTEIQAVEKSKLREIITNNSIFARISPLQKLSIIQSLHQNGDYVAVTGDGINDVPALQAANIGVAMGSSGTDAAREAASLVIVDDNFASIVAGIEEGRLAYANIRKIILLLVSTGLSEIILVMLSLFNGLPLPLHPIQLLWLNLVTNGLQDVALAFEPAEEDLLKRSPRLPNEPILDRIMIRKIVISAVSIGTFAFLFYKEILKETQNIEVAQSSVLMLMVFVENIHAGCCRSELRSVFNINPITNPMLIITVISATILHLIAVYSTVGQTILKVTPVPLTIICILLLVSLLALIVIEIEKFYHRSEGRTPCRN